MAFRELHQGFAAYQRRARPRGPVCSAKMRGIISPTAAKNQRPPSTNRPARALEPGGRPLKPGSWPAFTSGAVGRPPGRGARFWQPRPPFPLSSKHPQRPKGPLRVAGTQRHGLGCSFCPTTA